VPGSALLVGGDPGIGKSTIILQAWASTPERRPCVYISGEEAMAQVRHARRSAWDCRKRP
jgi:DNA repair protein RadA/Sms